MVAMILAAGLGTRLKPLTDKIPKALVEVEGIPMLQRVILNLKRHGVQRIIVNAHHFADQIINFLGYNNFGVEIIISDERADLLDTGGGIVKALPLLFEKEDSPVLIHNVDILSNADLNLLFKNSVSRGSTLLVSNRDSSRKLIFDRNNTLKGWHDIKSDTYKPEGFTPAQSNDDAEYRELAFSGIYTMNRKTVEEMKKLCGLGKFSVMDYFLHPERKEPLFGFEQAGLQILDIGKPATLLQASDLLKSWNI